MFGERQVLSSAQEDGVGGLQAGAVGLPPKEQHAAFSLLYEGRLGWMMLGGSCLGSLAGGLLCAAAPYPSSALLADSGFISAVRCSRGAALILPCPWDRFAR